MAKVESIGTSLLPIAVVAGLMGGTILRPPAPSESNTGASKTERPHTVEQEVVSAEPESLKDLRHVLALLGEALNVDVRPDDTLRAARALAREIKRAARVQPPSVTKDVDQAIQAIAADLQKRRRDFGVPLRPNWQRGEVLDGYLRPEVDPASRLHKLIDTLADNFAGEHADQEALARLIDAAVYKGNVQFLIATIPDYLDSNSDWVATESLEAIQAAMSAAGYVLDRFCLIDWSRDVTKPDTSVEHEGHLHERRPGALIFRKASAGGRRSRWCSWFSRVRPVGFTSRR